MQHITKTIYLIDCTKKGFNPVVFEKWADALAYYRELKERGMIASIYSYDCFNP